MAIDADAIPHSHPVLTLHTRHLDEDRLLLSTFVHEQLHWFLTSHPDESVQAALDDLRTAFTDAPTGFPEAADDDESTYLHLIINFLEREGLASILGTDSATSVIEFWASDHYRWIYRMVLERGDEIRRILEKHELSHDASAV